MTGIIFAAGIGSRLKPFTDFHPKAIAEVRGVPAVVRAAQRLINAGADRLIVNVHHFPAQVIDCLLKADLQVDLDFSDESACLLDTGGALAKIAREHPELTKRTEPIIVHNADIFTDFSLREMLEAYYGKANDSGIFPDATLLVDPKRSSSRRFIFNESKLLFGWINENNGALKPSDLSPEKAMKGTKAAFGGVHIIAPRLLNLLANVEQGEIFSITDYYLNHCSELQIYSFTPSGEFEWYDIGTPEKLAAANIVK